MNLSILIPRRKTKQNRPTLMQRIERAITNAYQRHMNYRYYLQRGHTPEVAREMARDTLP